MASQLVQLLSHCIGFANLWILGWNIYILLNGIVHYKREGVIDVFNNNPATHIVSNNFYVFMSSRFGHAIATI